MPTPAISSPQNPKMQRLRRLLSDRAQREEEGVIVLEGVRLCEEAFNAGWGALEAYHTAGLSERGQTLLSRLGAERVPLGVVEERVFRAIADTQNPQGMMVVFKHQPLPYPEEVDFLVLADTIRDPGNLGTLLRSAAAAGAQGVLLSPGCCDAWSPKVLRAGMGAHFRIPLKEFTWQDLPNLLPPELTLFAAQVVPEAESCWISDLRVPLVLAIGSEAEGLSAPLLALEHHSLLIPMPGYMESLNAGVAAGILLFEIVRQRQLRL